MPAWIGTVGEGKIREELLLGLRHFPIALHPFVTDDSGQAVGLSPNRCDFSYRSDFGGVYSKHPFRHVSEAARNCRLGYSWSPHLYQELFESSGRFCLSQ